MGKIRKWLRSLLTIPIIAQVYFALSNDRRWLERRYLKMMGFAPDFDNPRRFNEIINWMKLYDRNPLYTLCTDKIAARDYVASRAPSVKLVPMLAQGRNWDSIDFSALPTPFIIKTNHGSGDNHIVHNWAEQDEAHLRGLFTQALSVNYYYVWREWQYKNITPQIMVEELLQSDEGEVPADYKFHCFNYGDKTELILEFVTARFGDVRGTFYDESWNKLDIDFRTYPVETGEQACPPSFTELCQVARQLSADFHYVRVDLYAVGSDIYFGELTFTPSAGTNAFVPDKWDLIFGEKMLQTGMLDAQN